MNSSLQWSIVVRLEHIHSFIDNLDCIGTRSCRRRRPPGNAVCGHSSTMCLVVWWLSPQGQAGDEIQEASTHLFRLWCSFHYSACFCAACADARIHAHTHPHTPPPTYRHYSLVLTVVLAPPLCLPLLSVYTTAV